MKTIFRRALALAAALTVLLSALPEAGASWALGTELHQSVDQLGPGVTLTTQSLWSASKSDLRTERYVTYTPTPGVTPVVWTGDAFWTRRTLTQMAQTLENQGLRVLGGANGDYFVMATGEPLGSVVTGGVLRSGSPYYYAVGIRADGTAMVGKPGLVTWADFHNYHLIVGGGYNKTQRDQEGYALFSPEFGAKTGRSTPGVDVVLRPVSFTAADGTTRSESEGQAVPAELTIGGKAQCVVEQVLEGETGAAIPAGRFVLSIGYDNGEFSVNELKSLVPGETVTVSVTAAEARWQEAVSLIGAFEQIVTGGQEVKGLDTSMAPRTAVGVRADGQLILYTIDGRQAGYSVGAGVDQVARRLIELGCVEAVLFDGGGSTTLGTTGVLDDSFQVVNRPSAGSLRAVTNALFFVSDLPKTGEPGSFYITPQDGILLSGATAALSGWAVDTNGHRMYPMTEGVTYTASGPGTVEGNVLTAGTQAGDVTVTAETVGGVTGEATFTVVATPSSITVHNQGTGEQATGALTMTPGAGVDLTARAVWRNLPVTAADENFTWTVTPAVGTVSPSGVLTAGYAAASGELKVTAGEKTVSIPITVPGHVTLLEDFERWTLTTPQLGPETAMVARGRGSLAVTLAPGEGVAVPLDRPMPVGESYLGLQAMTAGGEATVTADVRLTDGTTVPVTLLSGALDQWTQCYASLPADAAAVTGFTVTHSQGGTVYLDQLVSANAAIYDATAPTVQVTVAQGRVSATLSDNVDRAFDPQRVTLTMDGNDLPFTLTGKTLTAELPGAGDGALHRVSVTVTDASGNIARGSGEVAPAAGTAPFLDTAGHWAEGYVTYLAGQGVAKGSVEADGARYYPDRPITRAEFAALLARWLRCDSAEYAGVALPFVDAANIPAWALGEVRALYARGIFNGSRESSGLYANPNAPISRAEAMTMLGRVQPKGYAKSPQKFTDDADVPTWAAEYVYILAQQGVVSGYGGAVRPRDPVTRAEVAKLLSVMW